jgi:hypothetical protein
MSTAQRDRAQRPSAVKRAPWLQQTLPQSPPGSLGRNAGSRRRMAREEDPHAQSTVNQSAQAVSGEGVPSDNGSRQEAPAEGHPEPGAELTLTGQTAAEARQPLRKPKLSKPRSREVAIRSPSHPSHCLSGLIAATHRGDLTRQQAHEIASSWRKQSQETSSTRRDD